MCLFNFLKFVVDKKGKKNKYVTDSAIYKFVFQSLTMYKVADTLNLGRSYLLWINATTAGLMMTAICRAVPVNWFSDNVVNFCTHFDTHL